MKQADVLNKEVQILKVVNLCLKMEWNTTLVCCVDFNSAIITLKQIK